MKMRIFIIYVETAENSDGLFSYIETRSGIVFVFIFPLLSLKSHCGLTFVNQYTMNLTLLTHWSKWYSTWEFTVKMSASAFHSLCSLSSCIQCIWGKCAVNVVPYKMPVNQLTSAQRWGLEQLARAAENVWNTFYFPFLLSYIHAILLNWTHQRHSIELHSNWNLPYKSMNHLGHEIFVYA